MASAQPAPSAGDRRTVAERLGYAPDARLLMIHADDLGMTHGTNVATFGALQAGHVQSASVLVPAPWFTEVARWAAAHPGADVGVHLALTAEWPVLRWAPVVGGECAPSLVGADGFMPRTQAAVAARASLAEVARELRGQIDRALAAGIRVTHLDAHMMTAWWSPAQFQRYLELGREYRLPLLVPDRAFREAQGLVAAPGQVLVDSIGGIPPDTAAEDWLATYRGVLSGLGPGVHVLLVHLAADDAELRAAVGGQLPWGAAWRQRDLDAVRDPGFRAFLREQGFILVDWDDLARAMPPAPPSAPMP